MRKFTKSVKKHRDIPRTSTPQEGISQLISNVGPEQLIVVNGKLVVDCPDKAYTHQHREGDGDYETWIYFATHKDHCRDKNCVYQGKDVGGTSFVPSENQWMSNPLLSKDAKDPLLITLENIKALSKLRNPEPTSTPLLPATSSLVPPSSGVSVGVQTEPLLSLPSLTKLTSIKPSSLPSSPLPGKKFVQSGISNVARSCCGSFAKRAAIGITTTPIVGALRFATGLDPLPTLPRKLPLALLKQTGGPTGVHPTGVWEQILDVHTPGLLESLLDQLASLPTAAVLLLLVAVLAKRGLSISLADMFW